MYKGKRVCVVIPAWNEEEPIGHTVKNFLTQEVDELIVVDNNSTDNTAKVARRAGATVVPEPIQGYGAAIRRGLREALNRGYDLIIITEADQTFLGTDIPNLLEHIDKHHFVVGTRTATPYLEEGANMGLFLVVGNIAVAKLLGLLHGYPPLTDVGCTLRLIRREMLEAILPELDAEGAAFSPQMIVKVLQHSGKMKEIPVHYLVRVGEAKITTSKRKAFGTGLKMIRVILGL
ncbi:MAG: glycosyltransferase family 2 protein [Candidatus Hermodarchaeota archaeon]|nr:glycosyltransferase family 2 protein [Candidatus Hermodarchaeota archaeon]